LFYRSVENGWPTSRKEYGLRVFENRVLRRYCGAEMEEVTRGSIALH
jgi:hypothetical protein